MERDKTPETRADIEWSDRDFRLLNLDIELDIFALHDQQE